MNGSSSTALAWSHTSGSRKPRIVLAASGSVAAIKFGILAESLSEWADVKAVVTTPAMHFIDKATFPAHVKLYSEEDEWSGWKKLGDTVLHIELRKWADALLIAPLSANTLAKIAGGICDNLLTSVVRAWDFSKPVFVAPSMNTFMWDSPFTVRHLTAIEELGVIIISPTSKKLACGDIGVGAMAEVSIIDSIVRFSMFKCDRPSNSAAPGTPA
ncbi:hypothetical protein O6H91_02G017600 [Diphasiastrum complanatum]|uniref:Uncharacterized protein n=1 Tax=Diphasiastrum complanatum TaxID=34168 RepID=A0ACC2ED80_DIPCM|nr:hypothetical protein O6H91_02G017600 [Diphasiastrum complanatum]